MGAVGICSLCLERAPLTFEHVPPRRAFNSVPTVAHTLYGLALGSKHKSAPHLLGARRGLGRYSLCRACNSRTGALYGNAFAEWTTQCLRYADRVPSGNRVLVTFHIEPLNVLKQIATMLIATSGPIAPHTQTDTLHMLRHFVLSPRNMGLPANIVFAAYFNPLDPQRRNKPLLTQNRLAGSCAILNVREGKSVFVLGEAAFPPMGYVAYLASDFREVPEGLITLCDLRAFTFFPYGQKADLFMHMPVRYPFGPVPGYYPNLNRPEGRRFVDDDHVVIV